MSWRRGHAPTEARVEVSPIEFYVYLLRLAGRDLDDRAADGAGRYLVRVELVGPLREPLEGEGALGVGAGPGDDDPLVVAEEDVEVFLRQFAFEGLAGDAADGHGVGIEQLDRRGVERAQAGAVDELDADVGRPFLVLGEGEVAGPGRGLAGDLARLGEHDLGRGLAPFGLADEEDDLPGPRLGRLADRLEGDGGPALRLRRRIEEPDELGGLEIEDDGHRRRLRRPARRRRSASPGARGGPGCPPCRA